MNRLIDRDGVVLQRTFLRFVSQDWSVNRTRPKSLVIVTSFRAAAWLRARRSHPVARVVYPVVAAAYKVFVEWILSVEIPVQTSIGPRLRIEHGVGIVINPHATLGSDVLIRHAVTIGNRVRSDDCPTIGDHVEFGANSLVLGDVAVGDDARIGAGALVLSDVPPGGVAVSRPAEIRPRPAVARV